MRLIVPLIALALAAAALPFGLAPGALAHEDPTYCEDNPDDDRCDPKYCEEHPEDLWCQSPEEYCFEHPDDPICEKDQGEPKEVCTWTVNGVPGSPADLILIPRGSAPGPQTVVLDCPHHTLVDWSCGYKSLEAGAGSDALPSDPECAHLGETTVEDPCRTANAWEVFAPNLNTYAMSLKASMWKDADCDGEPDDWNTSTDDGDCRLQNVYSPKTGGAPPTGYQPAPDGQLDECDMQHYEVQWRQTN